jgi:hypothetical protein
MDVREEEIHEQNVLVGGCRGWGCAALPRMDYRKPTVLWFSVWTSL